eukprot:9641033-Heterocapsa_arctica.AAC.1
MPNRVSGTSTSHSRLGILTDLHPRRAGRRPGSAAKWKYDGLPSVVTDRTIAWNDMPPDTLSPCG